MFDYDLLNHNKILSDLYTIDILVKMIHARTHIQNLISMTGF